MAAQFCYFDTGSDYGKWKLNHGDYDDHFNALFKRLVKPPRKIEFVDRRLGYFIGLIETRNETIIVCPGTRKSFQGLQDLGMFERLINHDFRLKHNLLTLTMNPGRLDHSFP